MTTPAPNPLPLSVVIPTKDRAEQLRRNLQGLAAQSLPADQFEVIVADNGSTDRTRELSRETGSAFPHFQFLQQPKPGAAAARNAGIHASRGEIVLFLDDDIIPDPLLLEEHRNTHRARPGAAVLGPVRFPWTGQESAFHWLLTERPESLQSFRFPDSENVPYRHFYTCNVSVPRWFFSPENLFDEALGGYGFEDIELGYRWVRAGRRIVFNPRASALHDFRRTFSQFAANRYRAGQALHYLVTKHPELEADFLARNRRGRRPWVRRLGFLAAPLAPAFDRRWPASSLLHRLLARFCAARLEYRFWAGFEDARRARPLPKP